MLTRIRFARPDHTKPRDAALCLPYRAAPTLYLIYKSGCIVSDSSVPMWNVKHRVELQRCRETHMAANFSNWAYVEESSDLRLSSHFKAGRLKRSGCVLTWICRGE